MNLHRQVHAKSSPLIGQVQAFDLWAHPGYARSTQYIAPFLSLVPQSPRLRAAPFGLFGLDPTLMMGLPAVTLPSPSGHARMSIPIPSLPVLRGKMLYLQGLSLHGATPRDWRFTNVCADQIK